MKKIISFIMLLIMSVSVMTSCSAAEIMEDKPADTNDFTLTMQIGNPNMTVNGEEKPIDEQGTVPIIVNNRTLLPVRAVVEEFGGTVSWDGETQEVTLKCGNDEIKLTIDSTTAALNGEEKTLDVAPTVINERTMLPIRFIAESFKFSVAWDDKTQTVTITKSNDDPHSKTLVAYFSRAGENYGVGTVEKGNTSYIADFIADYVDADVFEIKAADPYPVGYEDTKTRVEKEISENARPAFVGEIADIDEYDTVFLELITTNQVIP